MTQLPNAINLARRLSRQNEPDMLQESMVDDHDDTRFSQKFCETIADKINKVSDLPTECQGFKTIISTIQRRNSAERQDQAVAFAGMSAGEAAAAMSARDKGRLNHAQIQRRMTRGLSGASKNW